MMMEIALTVREMVKATKSKTSRLDLVLHGHPHRKLVINRIAGGVRKDERGKAAADDQEFDDQDILKEIKDTKIARLKVWHTNTNITGLQAIYRDPNGEIIEAPAVVSTKMQEQYREQDIDLESDDYVKEICGFLDRNEKYIQSLIITSAKGESRRVGNSSSDSKLFKFDINEYEFPSVLYGSVEYEYGKKMR